MAEDTNRSHQDKKWRFWQGHIKAWMKSGMSQREYCSKAEISSSQLSYWKKKLKNKSSPPVSFVPVSVPAYRQQELEIATNYKSGLTILFKTGVRIELDKDFTETTLLKLLLLLGGQS